ncbi:helix-turn-helix domain-containing protein [Halostella litorea]|uniref:helix-turn-helix domain-containing protein n=1 Tax=Halostella litorea TaxID=2528831 RepID=UPI001091D8AF|nr:helix-turn-helix domain-containing protein [Halostella litorea]
MSQADVETCNRALLQVWHGDCWGIDAASETGAEMLMHRVHRVSDGTAKGHFTVFDGEGEDIESFIDAVRGSEYTESVNVLPSQQLEYESLFGVPSADLIVDYDAGHSVGDALISEGFINHSPVHVRGTGERWPVFIQESRAEMETRLDRIRERVDAEIDVEQVISGDRQLSHGPLPIQYSLSPKQKEVVGFARQAGYYEWPRETSVREMSSEFSVSKTTFLEHLRKAEAKIMDP